MQYRDSSQARRRQSALRPDRRPCRRSRGRQASISGDAVVLEVGVVRAGSGAGPPRSCPETVQLVLTDLSIGMVEEAVELHPRQLRPSTARSDRGWPVDGHLDTVVANHMLYHVPDPSQAVAGLRRVVRDDGVLIAATNGPSHLHERVEITTQVFGATAQPRFLEAFGVRTTRARSSASTSRTSSGAATTVTSSVRTPTTCSLPRLVATRRAGDRRRAATPRRRRGANVGRRRRGAARHEGDRRVRVPHDLTTGRGVTAVSPGKLWSFREGMQCNSE